MSISTKLICKNAFFSPPLSRNLRWPECLVCLDVSLCLRLSRFILKISVYSRPWTLQIFFKVSLAGAVKLPFWLIMTRSYLTVLSIVLVYRPLLVLFWEISFCLSLIRLQFCYRGQSFIGCTIPISHLLSAPKASWWQILCYVACKFVQDVVM